MKTIQYIFVASFYPQGTCLPGALPLITARYGLHGHSPGVPPPPTLSGGAASHQIMVGEFLAGFATVLPNN